MYTFQTTHGLVRNTTIGKLETRKLARSLC